MVKRTVKFIKVNLTVILLGLLVFLTLVNLIIHFYYVDPTGQRFNNWISPVINLGGFIVIIATLLQMINDSKRKNSSEIYKGKLSDIKRYLVEEIEFKYHSLTTVANKENCTKLNFWSQYYYYKILLKNEYQEILNKVKNGEVKNPDEFDPIYNVMNDIYLLNTELSDFYQELYLKLKEIKTSELIPTHKVLIYKFLRDKLSHYMYFCGSEGFEYLRKDFESVNVVSFQTDEILELYNFIKNKPELKEVFIKYFQSA